MRATLDANRCVHLMSVAHILSGECLWGYQNLFSHEQKAYPPSTIEGAQRVTIVDGGVALNSGLEELYPNNTKTRCRRHLIQDLNNAGPSGKAAIATLQTISNMPRNSLPEVT